MPVYELEIVNTKLKSYRLLTTLIVFIQVCYFIVLLFDPTKRNWTLTNLLFVLAFLLYSAWRSVKTKSSFYFNEWIFFLLMILWVDDLVIAIANLVFFLLYSISVQKIIYTFSEESIKLKRFPFTTYEWNTLQNVILKDGILTLDFKNNKLSQHNLQQSDVNEFEFNQFAQQMLKTV